MAGYLLDANVISALMHAPLGRLSQRIARAGEGNVFTSVIVAAELAYGGAKKPSDRLTAALATIFEELDIRPLDAEAVRHYARLRHRLEQAGTPIGANDMFIAAHALALDATLVTDNEREFARVEGLRAENWLR
jgi:tRNA(fMet)-specific endonuclease VapC